MTQVLARDVIGVNEYPLTKIVLGAVGDNDGPISSAVPLPAELTGDNLDGYTNAIKTIPYDHHEIHDGNSYFLVYSALADSTDAIEVRIQTPNTTKWANMEIIFNFALAGTAELWTPTTKTDVVGNRLTPFNKNNNSSNTSGLTICHTPGGSQSGNANLLQYIGAATIGGRVITGGSSGSRSEFVLKQNSSYLIKLTSRADGNAMSLVLDWYEHTSLV